MKKKIFAICIVVALAGISAAILIFNIVSCNKADSAKLTSYLAKLEYNEASGLLSGEMTVEYLNTSDEPLSQICFNLYANSYEENSKYPATTTQNFASVYVDGRYSYGNIEILSIKSNDKEIMFNIAPDRHILSVPLATELYPDESFKMTISFEISLANINHRLGKGKNSINFGNFLPTACVFENGQFVTDGYSTNGDPFYSETADYNVEICVPKKYICAFSGKIASKTENGDCIDYNISAKSMREFAMVFSEKFKVASIEEGKTEILYYYYNDEKSQETLQLAKKSLEYFSKSYCTYPYETLSIVQTSFYSGGMEYPSLVYINDSLTDKSLQETVVHEIAHQWWYGIVGNNQIDYAFIDEGLSELSTMMFFDKNSEYGMPKSYFINRANDNYSIFCRLSQNITGKVNRTMQRKLAEFGSEYEYVAICYSKSLLMFEQVLNALGETKLNKGLAKYANENKFKIGTLAKLQHCLSQGIDVAPIMNSYISGKV